MTFFKSLFGKKDKPEADVPSLTWIEASQNPWRIKLLDLRPITQGMFSTSQDPQMAVNAISYGSDDGTSFIHQEPESGSEINSEISLAVDPMLVPGVLFIPQVMEHKWAIFFHQNTIIFVRSWLRKVAVTAKTSQQNGRLYIHKIKGQFSDDDDPQFIRAIVKFLLISHAIAEIFPAPLPPNLSFDLKSAGLWAMSIYGNMAQVGTFTSNFEGSTQSPLRSQSLLHIAAARSDLDEINVQVENGIPIDILAADGLAPLHWSLAAKDLQAMQHLLKLGADPNVRSVEGATPIMNAVQSNKVHHLNLLISSGADVNAQDIRGFTSLHRAVEMGYAEIVAILLNNGADSNIEAGGHTPLSLAEMRGEKKIVSLLRDYQ
jgi:ankyrin repeat protein